MGVAGSGKSTIGPLLARELGVPFFEGDVAHSAEAVAQMGAGVPLTEAQRVPWLDRLHDVLAAHATTGVVLACSALTADARGHLARDLPAVRFVALVAPAGVLERRLADRRGHFAGRELLASQLETLALDDEVTTVDANRPVDEVVAEAAHVVRDR
jgi:gluconokinase